VPIREWNRLAERAVRYALRRAAARGRARAVDIGEPKPHAIIAAEEPRHQARHAAERHPERHASK
jgi:hypothetical protein